MFTGFGSGFVSSLLCGTVESVSRAAQGNFPQGNQVLFRKKMVKRPLCLPLLVDFTGLQPDNQVSRFNIHQLYLVGGIKNVIGYPFADGDMGNGFHQIVERLQMLNIYGGIDIDTRPQKLFDILITLGMTASRRVAVRQFVHQNQLWSAAKCGVNIEFF